MSRWSAVLNPARFPIVESISLAGLIAFSVCSQWFGPTPIDEPGRLAAASGVSGQYQLRTVEDLPQPLTQFKSVFWEPRDTESLRKRVRTNSDFVRGKSVLEVGTGTGLIAFCCLQAGAAKVVVTDVNAAAIANANHNADRIGMRDRWEARLVPLTETAAFSTIRPEERFDLIVSNPPWENARPRTIAEYALYDPDFLLLRSLLAESRRHLNPGGRMWLAYGCTEAIREIQSWAPRHGWQLNWLDDRLLENLPPVFLPGLLLELIPIVDGE